MDLSQLEVFLTVARERRFSRAAEKLFRTQSAVSQTIRKLELDIGEPLFDRSSRDGVLTDAGRVLQEYAEKLLNLRQDAQTALVEMRELQKGKLVIAANEFTALYLLPVLGEFRRLHPTIKITVRRSLGSQIPDDVLKHNVELGILSYDPQEPHLRSAVVYLDELALIVPPGHPLASAGEVSVRQLGAESFVAHIVASPYRDMVIEVVPPPQNSLTYGRGTPHAASHQAFRVHGQREWRWFPKSAWKARSPAETWCAFRCAICIFSASCAWCIGRNPTLSHAGRAFLKVAEQVAKDRGGRYRFQREK